MRKLLLKCFLSPGDIVMLTAAIRDLHSRYPSQFLTDVRTSSPALWENNPYLTPLGESDPDVQVIDCHYPLINRANRIPYHFVYGFIQFLNEKLDLNIQPSALHGDIHLTPQEKLWYSQVRELTGEDTPFWIVVAGGKYDVTIKWWETSRYQAVVDHFRGKIQFVQVGQNGHHHPPLKGVIDLRGQTDLRQVVRLVYHAQGVLCPVTAMMHLAAAVEFKSREHQHRPCVVVAGGREPVQWEAYPYHQFIHTIGDLSCCRTGGCWKARTFPLGDSDERDNSANWCVDPVGRLPRCMHLISPREVIRRIESFFSADGCRYLNESQAAAAERGVEAAASNPFDDHPINIHTFRSESERFINTIPPYPRGFAGRGIVICGGGLRYFTNAWVCINMLRRFGCRLPIQLWHFGTDEVDPEMAALVAPLGVECIDAFSVRKKHPARLDHVWALKPYAILHSPFQEVMLLDADNVPVRNVEYLFSTPQFVSTGALFWPDYPDKEPKIEAWRFCGVTWRPEPPFESGQIVVDKARCWPALCLAMWYNEQSHFLYKHVHGDKDTFHLAFRRLKLPYSMPSRPIHRLEGTMCQHDFDGKRLFQHRNLNKWNLSLTNKRVDGFWLEDECRRDVKNLRNRWDGRASFYGARFDAPRHFSRSATPPDTIPSITACMISCRERNAIRFQTLANLARTDWGDRPVLVQLDSSSATLSPDRITDNALAALTNALALGHDYILFMEDDVTFNSHFLANIMAWAPFRERRITFAGLYNPGLRELACDVHNNFFVVDPYSVYGGQGLLISAHTARFILEHRHEGDRPFDLKFPRLASRLGQPIFYHCPSLIQHVGKTSTWGGRFHQAADFDPSWQAVAPQYSHA